MYRVKLMPHQLSQIGHIPSVYEEVDCDVSLTGRAIIMNVEKYFDYEENLLGNDVLSEVQLLVVLA